MSAHRSAAGDHAGDDRLVEVQLEVTGDLARLRVDGELDFFTCVTLADHLAQVVAADARRAVVELEGTTFVSLAAFRAFVAAGELLASRGTSMVLRDPPRSLRILHEVVGGTALVLEDSPTSTRA